LRDERRNYLVAGSFVLAMLVVLLVWLALLAGRPGATEPYFVVYERVHGLRSGTEIFYDGYPVGLIDGITPVETPDGRRFRVDLRIRRGWPVPEDSSARVLQGLFSRVVVDIRGGRSERLVPPGGEIPGEATGDVFASAGELVVRVAGLVEELEPLVHRAAGDAPEILAHVTSLVADLDRAGTQLGRVLSPGNVDRVGRALENLEHASQGLAPLGRNLDRTRAQVDELLARVNELLREDRGDVSVALRELEHSLSAVAQHIDAISADLETSSRNLAEFTRQVREDPAVLVRGRDHPDDEAQP
jgi:phospholipid/cholesterol/gamma-HCH transport system substrate-binding protein